MESNARREMFRCEYRFRRADGAYRWGIDIGRPRFSPEGEYLGYVGSVIDIDDRKRAEDRLRRSEAEAKQSLGLLYELVEQCPFGIYIVDADFRIATMNRGSQDGAFANVRPVIGRPFDEAIRILWPEPVAADILRTFRHTLDTGEPYSSKDFVNPRADEDRVEGYEWELHRVTLPDGRPGVACYFFDATRLTGRPRRRSARTTGGRTSSSPCSPTSCGTRWRPSATPSTAHRPESSRQEHVDWSHGGHRAADAGTSPG